MLYSHDGLGLGHFRRNLVLAEALTQAHPGASVLLGCSAEGTEAFPLPERVDLLKMPGLRKVDNERYVSQHLKLPPLEASRLRSSLLTAAVLHFRPHVLLADKHPLGVGGELLSALQAQRRGGGRNALGLRDVLDDPARVASEWQAAGLAREVAAHFQRILIYGSPHILTPLQGLLPAEAHDRVRYTGYVVGSTPAETQVDGRPSDLPAAHGRPLVVATVGGGMDGWAILETFIEASSGAAWRGVAVAGPQMPLSRWQAIQALAADHGVIAIRSVSLVQRWFRAADALVCMGGYNTLLEAVASGTPTVCVPRSAPRTEQLIRAEAFSRHGLVRLVEPDALGAAQLRHAIEQALRTPRHELSAKVEALLDVEGAGRAASHLIKLAAEAATERTPPTRSTLVAEQAIA